MSRQKAQPFICDARIATKSRIVSGIAPFSAARLNSTSFLYSSGDCWM